MGLESNNIDEGLLRMKDDDALRVLMSIFKNTNFCRFTPRIIHFRNVKIVKLTGIIIELSKVRYVVYDLNNKAHEGYLYQLNIDKDYNKISKLRTSIHSDEPPELKIEFDNCEVSFNKVRQLIINYYGLGITKPMQYEILNGQLVFKK